MTKPNCTLLVIQAAWERLSDISSVNSGITAVAEYHVVNERARATPVTTRTNQRFKNTFDNQYSSNRLIYLLGQLPTKTNINLDIVCILIGNYLNYIYLTMS